MKPTITLDPNNWEIDEPGLLHYAGGITIGDVDFHLEAIRVQRNSIGDIEATSRKNDDLLERALAIDDAVPTTTIIKGKRYALLLVPYSD